MDAPGPFQDKTALRGEALCVARGGRVLFEDVSFRAKGGDYLEIRGANGAGKTSLLRAIAGFLAPRAGRVVFEGAEEPALALHFVGHLNGLKGAASVASHLRYWAGLFGGAATADVLERIGLRGYREAPARALSQGQQRRLALARLLIAPRPVWLLDEPAAALDDAGRAMLTTAVDAHRARGGLVLAAVHEALGPAPSATIRLGRA